MSVGGANALQTAAERRDELARDLVAAAYLRGAFVLSSGQPSRYYIDKYLFATKPTVLRRLASLLAERVPDVDRIAGPELGAVPITAVLSLETGVPFVIVRDARKAYGPSAAIEGELHAGERVLLVEDVVSTAAQALTAAAALAEAGATVAGVLAVVDREQGGAEAVTAAGLSFDALFRLSELPLPEELEDR
ncbi:MAG: orotate phosphoribosyltransferase [Streptosporangiales bacterium]|nr:orotate phosphoribosyltransferase [Streptosporangiales bacterium]